MDDDKQSAGGKVLTVARRSQWIARHPCTVRPFPHTHTQSYTAHSPLGPRPPLLIYCRRIDRDNTPLVAVQGQRLAGRSVCAYEDLEGGG